MAYSKETAYIRSSKSKDTLVYFLYKPRGKIKALVQLVHGMAEHVERYEAYISYLTDRGYLVFGDNHLGHKGSLASDEKLGFFADHMGWQYLVKDEVKLSLKIRKDYPGKPLFLYGHSMGSFICRVYLTKYSDLINGVILSGTSGSNPMMGPGKMITKAIMKIKGPDHHSPFINKLMFGTYNKKYKEVNSSFAWLTRDEEVVRAYEEDPYCGFVFTAAAYYDLECLLDQVTKKEWYEKIPADLPILFISGSMDPVGGWGKGLEEIKRKMISSHAENYEMKIFPDMRHEIHNEIGKERVAIFVADWLDKKVRSGKS